MLHVRFIFSQTMVQLKNIFSMKEINVFRRNSLKYAVYTHRLINFMTKSLFTPRFLSSAMDVPVIKKDIKNVPRSIKTAWSILTGILVNRAPKDGTQLPKKNTRKQRKSIT